MQLGEAQQYPWIQDPAKQKIKSKYFPGRYFLSSSGAEKLFDVLALKSTNGYPLFYPGQKVGRVEVETFLRKAELVREVEGKDLQTLSARSKTTGVTNSCVTRMLSTGVKPDIDDIVLE